MNTAKELSKLGSIPQVNKHAQLITEIQDKYFWEKSSIKKFRRCSTGLKRIN